MSTYYQIFRKGVKNKVVTEKLDMAFSDLCSPADFVKLTEMGNVTEIQYLQHKNNSATIKMLQGGDRYINLSDMCIYDCKKHDTRAEQKKSLYRTFANARALINTNVTDVDNVRWITLTYSENMTDTKRLYDDFRRFNMRFQDFCKKNDYGKAEYIVMMEPQGRGAWHCHLLYIWQHKAPYIANDILAKIWGNGFVKIKKLDNVDNVGAYLTAYLGDMEVSEVCVQDLNGTKAKFVDITENGETVRKCYVKGARLNLYPANFNMIRYSRGIKKPIETYMTYQMAEKKVSAATKTFETSVKISDDNGFSNIICKSYYNSIRPQMQDNRI